MQRSREIDKIKISAFLRLCV